MEAIILSVPGTIAAIAAIDTRRTGRANHRKLGQIDEAVNGAAAGDASIRQNVQTLVAASEKEN